MSDGPKVFARSVTGSIAIGNTGHGTNAPRAPTVDELKAELTSLAHTLKAIYGGERCAVMIAVGFPVAGGHDRFAAKITGPCLASRGLLAWATRSINKQIDDNDTSLNDKNHP